MIMKSLAAPILLFLLGSVSVVFAILQASLLAQGDIGAQNPMAVAYYFSMPLPIIIHIICGSLFNICVPLQYMSYIRTRFNTVHKTIGVLLIFSALGFGSSALWMNHFYPQYGGTGKYLGMLAHCAVVVVSVFYGVRAIRKKDIQTHKLWMMRLTAAALSPATQRVMIMPAVLVFGEEILTNFMISFVIVLGLVINLGFVEYLFLRTNRKMSVYSY